jgi:hypothetical protein
LRARLLGPAMQGCGIFRSETVARLLDEHVSGGSDHSHVLWLLLVFEGFLDARHSAPHHAGELAMAHG